MKVIIQCVVCLAICGAGTAKEPPRAVFGYGTVTCSIFTNLSSDTSPSDAKDMSERVFAWAEGWFSAKNVLGHAGKPLTVGGSLSDKALKAMLVDECYEHPNAEVSAAVASLYDKIAKAGL